MPHHLAVIVETAIVEIRRVEIGVAKRRRLEKSAGTDVMLLMIDECARRNVTTGTAQIRIVWKRLLEQRFAATLGFVDVPDHSAARAETGIRQEVDVLDVSND